MLCSPYIYSANPFIFPHRMSISSQPTTSDNNSNRLNYSVLIQENAAYPSNPIHLLSYTALASKYYAASNITHIC